MNEPHYRHLRDVLTSYGREVQAKYKAQLTADGRDASGALRKSLSRFPVVRQRGNDLTLYLALEDYWKYLERGTRMQGPYKQQGQFPPVSALLEWVRIKPVIPVAGKNGKIPTEKQLAYLIARKIWRDGTPPYGYLEKSLGNRDDVLDRCRQAAAEDLEEWVRDLIDELGI